MGHPALIVSLVLASVLATVAAAEPPKVSPPDPVVGDGRSVAPVVVTSEPVKGVKELPVPDVAALACTGASTLPAANREPPVVLAPVVARPTRVECVARVRNTEAKFTLEVRPPPAGLYASAAAFAVKSTTRELALDTFVWNGTTRSAPSSLRSAASDGKITARDGKLVLDIAGNAPRLIAIALADGDRLGAAFVPVSGVTTIPVEADAGSSVQMWIAGSWFGPVKTKGRIAQVLIEVPPGVTHGVARSTGREGYVTDAITDLKIPARPRIAATAANPQVRAGEATTIAIAVAGKDGRPGAPALPVIATAQRGTVGAVQSLGGGLWSVRYTAPTSAGADRVTIRIDGDKAAGSSEVSLEVGAGGAARIEIDLPSTPYEPGAEIAGTVRVFDAAGNPQRAPAVTATLAGVALTVTGGEPVSFRGRIPERLPHSGELSLEIVAGAANQRRAVATRSTATAATGRAIVDGRTAIVELAVRDRFGNLVQDGAFELEVTGAKLVQIRRGARAFEASIDAHAGVATARVLVRTNGRVLASEDVRFEPPANALVLGAWGSGGWVDNLGVLASPRASAGIGIRRGHAIELALLLGVEGLAFSDTTQVVIEGMTIDATRSVRGVGLVSWVRGRVRLSRRFGAALALGVVPTRFKVKLETGVQSPDDYAETVLGVRAQAQLDARLGPGRVFVGGAYGRAALEGGAVVGQIDGIAVVGGYEWWFAALGR